MPRVKPVPLPDADHGELKLLQAAVQSLPNFLGPQYRPGGGLEHPIGSHLDQIIGWKNEGKNYKEIASALGVSHDRLRTFLSKLRKRHAKLSGKDFDIDRKIETETVPLAQMRVQQYLMEGNSLKAQALLGMEVLKGRGHYRVHQAVKQEPLAQEVTLIVKVEMTAPEGTQAKVVAGSIVGRPHGSPEVVVQAEAVECARSS